MTITYHLLLNQEKIRNAKYAIVPGDPGRARTLATAFSANPTLVAANREFHTYLVDYEGEPIVVCSTGIGGPSTAIVVEELAAIGIQHFIRVGTSGSIQPHIKLGDIIITKAAVRLDGASKDYAPIEYPAVASLDLTSVMLRAVNHLKIPYHAGITASTDTFYPGQERYDNYNSYVIKELQGSLDEWQKLNVSNFEMESATLLTMANVFGLDAACMCGVIAQRTQAERPNKEIIKTVEEYGQKIAVETIRRHIAWQKSK